MNEHVTDKLPKLLVLGTEPDELAALRDVLGDRFELIRADPAEAGDAIEREGCAAVLAAAETFRPLERHLAAHQAAVLLEAIGEGVCLTDRDGRVVWSNARFRSFQSVLRQRLADICEPAVRHFDRVCVDLPEDRPAPTKRYNLSLRRSQRYFECLITPVLDRSASTARVSHLAIVLRDVTSRDRTQRKIDALDRAGRELLHFEPEVIRTMHAAERLALLEERFQRYAHDLLSFDHFAVRLTNETTNELQLVMSSGMPDEATGIQLFAEGEGQGISGYVAATGRSYICPDAANDPRYVFGLDHAGSSLTVPIKLFDKVIGILNVEAEEIGAFSEQDRQFAEIFASYLAMSFHLLNLLLAERSATRETATGTMRGQISAPLNDLVTEAERLREEAGGNEELGRRVERILEDVAAIRRRVREVAQGPQTLLGVQEAIEAAHADPVLDGKRILVVDNERVVAETVEDILCAHGCEVVTCEDGLSAIRLLDQWRLTHDMTEAFDLVISDINLGDRTGYEIFAAAKHASDEIPVILMTGFGYDPHHSIVRASQEGLQCVLFKPFQAAGLVEECRKAQGGSDESGGDGG